MKIMQRHTALEVNNRALRSLGSSWPKTGEPIPSPVQGNAKALQSGAWSAYRRDLADRKFMAELDAILASLPE
mgnify:CR=1 FL=1